MFGWLKSRRRKKRGNADEKRPKQRRLKARSRTKVRSSKAGPEKGKARRSHGPEKTKRHAIAPPPAAIAAPPPKPPAPAKPSPPATVVAPLPPPVTQPKPPPAVEPRPKVPGVAAYGMFAAPIGLGEAARRGVEALRRAGIPLSTHSTDVRQVPFKVPFPADDPDAPVYDTAILHFHPGPTLQRIARPLSDRRRIGVWHWELPVFPPRWANDALAIDEIWAPSRFIADLVRAALNKPVHLVPHPALVVPIDAADARAALGLPGSRRIILTAFDFRSHWARKNPEAVLRAFADAFSQGGESPLLVVKYHRDDKDEDREQAERIRATPNVLVIDRTMTQEEMRMLYAASDAFVSLHRSEGVGLNLLDMMGLGRVCVATGFSGNLDFMSADNSILIPWTMRAVGRGEYPHGDGQWWAEPDHDAAVEAMRFIGTASDTALAALGERARIDTDRDFSLERVGAIARAAWIGEKSADGGNP